MSSSVESVAVAIITCKRPDGLEKLLSALMRLKFPDFPAIRLRIVVVENGVKLAAEGQVECFREAGLDIVYAHEPRPGISYARNRAMEIALSLGEYMAFIDDDEYPAPNWLNALLGCALSYHAQIVRGPVIPVFPEGAPRWAEAGGFFNRERHPSGTAVRYGASNNILIETSLLREDGLRFDHRFALTGGEDTFFFMQLQMRTGVEVVWSDEAIVFEDVPMGRITGSWLARRASREGSNMPQFAVALGGKAFFRFRWFVQGVAHMLIAALRWCLSLATGKMQRVGARCEFSLGLGMVRGSIGHVINEYADRH